MTGTTLIGFAGFCKSDIMLYLSRILHISGSKVAIIDRSNEQELRYCVPDGANCGNMAEYRNVDIYFDYCKGSIANLPLTEYSAVLIDLGVNYDTYEDIKSLKVLYIVSDLNRYHIMPLSAWIKNLTEKPDAVRILRDTVFGKIRAEYIDFVLGTREFTNLVGAYEFAFDEIEYSTRLSAQYDDIFKFQRIPKCFKKMLTDCMTEIFQIEPKTAFYALKKAQAGG
ncbi:hypothetical protein Cst_c13640 [Thermoclostridium stercorarium subsp. stercorarium DSM 8532]|uniref:Uncharacterized protein n=2 Tax=Thermoclostridium stercorarium TaxID=1510 RepID=L7VJR3_THES1|nr:hypothetical protein [Thermoclostridium stercorarium]AGC68355.1 hypothetical protein Cst_c13640 [Thermoclostridium stercorarium subsp. stercorarium DSM 8532]AGI39378.1 hypothetical protein Clst_1317 [Thermoclostridium stercorarium subsp. stercorarium DSM 8532]ANW98697.1 hypothetical protein CSTERTH_06465 [Thermoclostridium stercorarium subsp. thermolacticum DSM 2910]UZQ86864.1 hypothetical protein ODU73_001356 [Thermoclostridium stercorarium]